MKGEMTTKERQQREAIKEKETEETKRHTEPPDKEVGEKTKGCFQRTL